MTRAQTERQRRENENVGNVAPSPSLSTRPEAQAAKLKAKDEQFLEIWASDGLEEAGLEAQGFL